MEKERKIKQQEALRNEQLNAINKKVELKQKEKETMQKEHYEFKEKINLEDQLHKESLQSQKINKKVVSTNYDQELSAQASKKLQAPVDDVKETGLKLESYSKKPLKF